MLKKYRLKDGSIYWHRLYYDIMPRLLTQYGPPLGSMNYAAYLLQPHEYVIDLYDQAKWFIQRGMRGYSDSDVRGWYIHHARIMVGVLASLRKTSHGYPMGLSPARWDKKLATMQDGFQAVIDEEEDFTSYKKLGRAANLRLVKGRYRRTQKGLRCFGEYYHNLWD